MTELGSGDRLWDHEETARFLHISPTKLYRLTRENDGPPAFKLGNRLRYDPAAVRTWLTSKATGAAA